MTTDPITTEVSTRISRHMNTEHKKAIVAYAKHYGGVKNPVQAKMISLTKTAMKLEVDGKLVQIAFTHTLRDSEDAHLTLVAMLKAIPDRNS